MSVVHLTKFFIYFKQKKEVGKSSVVVAERMIHSNYEKLFQIKHFLSRNDKGSKTHNFAPVRQLYEAKMQRVMLFALAAKSIFDITLSLFCHNQNSTHPTTRWCCFSKH